MGSAPGAYRYRSVHGGAAAWPGALAKLGYRLTYTRYRDSRIRSPSSSPSSLSSSGCCCTLLSPSLSLYLYRHLPLSSLSSRSRSLIFHLPAYTRPSLSSTQSTPPRSCVFANRSTTSRDEIHLPAFFSLFSLRKKETLQLQSNIEEHK